MTACTYFTYHHKVDIILGKLTVNSIKINSSVATAHIFLDSKICFFIGLMSKVLGLSGH